MTVICTVVLYQSRLDAMEHAIETSRNVALLAENDVVRNFELYALSLQAVVDGLNDSEVMAASPHLRNAALFDKAATATYLGSILVLDADGKIALNAGAENSVNGHYSDHDFFKVHKGSPSIGLYVGDPYSSTLHGGSLSIPLSRRISHADGSFAGIVLIDVQLEYFQKLFSALSLGKHGSLALIRKDGAMMMRQPFDAKVIGRNIRNASTFQQFMSAPEGSFSDTSYLDGAQRAYYFKNLPSLPFIIMVAKAHSDIYAVWRQRALLITSVMGTLTMAFIGLSFAFGVQLKRRMRAESELALLARTDGLTGLNNRRKLDEIIEHEWHRAKEVTAPSRCCSWISTGSRPTTTPTGIRPGMRFWRPWPDALPTISGAPRTVRPAMGGGIHRGAAGHDPGWRRADCREHPGGSLRACDCAHRKRIRLHHGQHRLCGLGAGQGSGRAGGAAFGRQGAVRRQDDRAQQGRSIQLVCGIAPQPLW
jgi:hypothetical protein